MLLTVLVAESSHLVTAGTDHDCALGVTWQRGFPKRPDRPSAGRFDLAPGAPFHAANPAAGGRSAPKPCFVRLLSQIGNFTQWVIIIITARTLSTTYGEIPRLSFYEGSLTTPKITQLRLK